MSGDEYPREFLPANLDDTKIADFRNVAEFLFARNTTAEDRAQIRDAAEGIRTELIADGVDLDDIDDCEILWQGWYTTCRTYQPYLIGDVPGAVAEEIHYHAVRAMQWSGMILLLVTEPNVPEPIPSEENQ